MTSCRYQARWLGPLPIERARKYMASKGCHFCALSEDSGKRPGGTRLKLWFCSRTGTDRLNKFTVTLCRLEVLVLTTRFVSVSVRFKIGLHYPPYASSQPSEGTACYALRPHISGTTKHRRRMRTVSQHLPGGTLLITAKSSAAACGGDFQVIGDQYRRHSL